MNTFRATRIIGIDAGHRVTYHGSKCKNIHGHRYEVHCTMAGGLTDSGPEQGMVADFGFMKEAMMTEIDAPCDHGLIMWAHDPLVEQWAEAGQILSSAEPAVSALGLQGLQRHVKDQHYLQGLEWAGGKLYLVDVVPTAENLAHHWFKRLERVLLRRYAKPEQVTVWETPNAYASYPTN